MKSVTVDLAIDTQFFFYVVVHLRQVYVEAIDHRSGCVDLYHSCFHISAFRFISPKMNFGSSVLHIVVEPATDCCQ